MQSIESHGNPSLVAKKNDRVQVRRGAGTPWRLEKSLEVPWLFWRVFRSVWKSTFGVNVVSWNNLQIFSNVPKTHETCVVGAVFVQFLHMPNELKSHVAGLKRWRVKNRYKLTPCWPRTSWPHGPRRTKQRPRLAAPSSLPWARQLSIRTFKTPWDKKFIYTRSFLWFSVFKPTPGHYKSFRKNHPRVNPAPKLQVFVPSDDEEEHLRGVKRWNFDHFDPQFAAARMAIFVHFHAFSTKIP